MQRRKFIASIGSVAAGAAAVTGTGAFTSTTANRAVNVETAGDVDAYLGLDASVSPHAEQTGGTAEFQFDGSSEEASGQGLNQNADTTFTDVLRIENQGTEPFRLQIYSGTGFGSFAQGPLVVSYSDEELAPNGKSQTSSTAFANSPDAPSYWSGPNGANGSVGQQDLGVGDDLYLHFSFFLSDRTDFGANNNPEDIPDQIIFNADSTATDTNDFS